MINSIKCKINEKCIIFSFILICVIFAGFVAVIQPSNSAPDEKMKMDICKYIADNGKLPHGGDEAVLDPSWGISYGFTPITPYIFAGVFIKITSNFTQDIHAYYVVSRFVTVICYGIFILFNIKIAKELFKSKYYKALFVVLTSLLPQMIYLGTYLNNDCFAMMTISMIVYYGIVGLKNGWTYKNCIKYGLAIGLCAVSYYNAYGYILTSVVLFVASQLKNKISVKEIIKKGLLVSGVVFLIAGWWFIRSAIIYNGDFLGLRTTDEYSNKYAIDECKANNRTTPQKEGISLKTMLIDRGWIITTLHSFVGVFGGMNIPTPKYISVIALAIVLVGIVGFLVHFFRAKKHSASDEVENSKLLEIVFMIDAIIPVALSLYYSYSSDFQPQGRYIMPMLVPLMFFVTKGIHYIIEKLEKRPKVQKGLKVALICALCFVLVISMKVLVCAYIK